MTVDPQTLTITIPVQLDAALSPNARGGWWRRHRAVQDARTAAYYAARNANAEMWKPAPPLVLHWLIAHGKRRRRWDDTNAIAATKPLEDGIADAIGINDRHFRFGSITQDRDSEGQGFIRVVIEESPA